MFADLRVAVVEQQLEQLARCAVRCNDQSPAYRGIRVLHENHPEGLWEAAVQGERVCEPVVVCGNDLGDHAVAQVRPLSHPAKALAVAEEPVDELRR
ncbi:hypothetical protein [Streptomyces xanthophaeus]